ncbi:MAG: hypothetical protein D6685_15960 [Bacteroidetes bacterium]|nr:hypothetical protein AWN76_000915 [Rhodothermaceae bacterium RA]RMH53251.1 MAG: hypothetical protein D6685_15960 [Bacteroidota bacterium]
MLLFFSHTPIDGMSLVGLTLTADLHYASRVQQQSLHDVLWRDDELHPLIQDMLIQQGVQFMQALLEDASLSYRAEATIQHDEEDDEDEPYEHLTLEIWVVMDRERDEVVSQLEHEDTADQLEDLVLQVLRDHLPRSAFEQGLEIDVEVAGVGYR